MLRSILSRGTGLRLPLYTASHSPVCKASSSSEWGGQEKGYKYVNPDKELTMSEITDNVATTIFWTELFRGHLPNCWTIIYDPLAYLSYLF